MRFHSACRVGVLLAMVAGMSLVGMATPASAYQGAPPPAWSVFKQCPVNGTLSHGEGPVEDCIFGIASEGTIDIGGLDTTFKGPGTIQGGINYLTYPAGWANALNGQSYSAPRQLLAKPVMAMLGNPSGVVPPAQSAVYVVSAQAGPMNFGANSHLVSRTHLPLSFHLINPLLGPNCYVGTVGDPVVLNLTTGKSGALKGTLGIVASRGPMIYTTGTEVVDNVFSVPGATGCGPDGYWDAAIDSNNALPSAKGLNEAILYGGFDFATASQVIAHHG